MNIKLFSIAILLGLTQTQDITNSRIIGGYEVNPKFQYSWMLSLSYLKEHQCGGMIYKKDTLITAAHCTRYEMKNWDVNFHRHDFNKPELEEQGKSFKVINWKKHPDYDANKFELNDVAIWKINGDFGLQIKDMVLINEDENLTINENQLLTTIGWGATQEKGSSSKTLMELKLPIYNIKKCIESYNSVQKNVNETVMFCAGYPDGNKDACQGDSGGPIFKFDNGNSTLVGITSWGYGCAQKGFPGIYTKLHMFKSFINQNL